MQHRLLASPKTVAWGYYDAAATPVLRVRSGDVVQVSTLITSSPARLEAAGVKPADVEPALRAIYDSVKTHGPGGHILTGPIYVEGADSGDVLEVRIRQVDLAIPYAYNSFGGRSGFIPEDYGYAKTKIIPLDKKTMMAHFADGIDIPLHPFFGSIGVAPPASMGKVSSAPPGIYAGNLDNKELVAGTTLYIPVHTKGALLEIGDGHAGQGNGEVDITALETSLIGRFPDHRAQGPQAHLAARRDADALDRHGDRQGPGRRDQDRRAAGHRVPRHDEGNEQGRRVHARQHGVRRGHHAARRRARRRARDDPEADLREVAELERCGPSSP